MSFNLRRKKIFLILFLLSIFCFSVNSEESEDYYYNLAVEADKAGDIDTAIFYFEKVCDVSEKLYSTKLKTATWMLATYYLYDKQDFVAAENYCKYSLKLSEKTFEYDSYISENLGISLPSDIKNFFVKIDIYVYEILDTIYSHFQFYKEQKESLDSMAELIDLLPNGKSKTKAEIEFYRSYSSYYWEIEDIEKAIQYGLEAKNKLNEYRLVDPDYYDMSAPLSYGQLLFFYERMGENYKKKASNIVKEMESEFKVECSDYLANYYIYIDDLQKAEKYLFLSLAKAVENLKNNPNSISGDNILDVYKNLAYLYILMDDYDSAKYFFFKDDCEIDGEIYPLNENWGSATTLLRDYGWLSEFNKHDEKWDLYIKNCESILGIVKDLKQEDYIAQIRQAYDFLAVNLECLPEEYSEQKNELKEQALNLGLLAMEEINYLLPERKSEFLEKSAALYYAAIHYAAEKGDGKNAFYYSESLRSKSFIKDIGNRASLQLPEVTDEEKNQLEELSMQIQLCNEKLSQGDNAQIREELLQYMGEYDALEKSIGERVPQFASLRNPKVVSAEEAQKWCGKKRAVLEYVLWNPEYGDKAYGNMQSAGGLEFTVSMRKKQETPCVKSYCLVVTEKNTVAVPLDSDFDYAKAVKEFRAVQADKPKKAMTVSLEQSLDASSELYEKLIKPVLKYIPKGCEDLVIVPDGPLSSLPFHILGSSEKNLLGEKYAVTMSPAISVSMMRQKEKKRELSVLGIGNPLYKLNPRGKGGESGVMYKYEDVSTYLKREYPSWNNLAGTAKELECLQNEIFSPKICKLYTQEMASEKSVKELSLSGQLASYSNILFACHGLFDDKYPRASTLILSEQSDSVSDSLDDGYLTAEEIAVLKMDANFFNMSACLTGLAHNKPGDGMTGLTRACIVAGADYVGATLWQVSDDATDLFMQSLYKKVKKGMDVKKAYKKTRQEFRKSRDYPEPYFWAPFVLYE